MGLVIGAGLSVLALRGDGQDRVTTSTTLAGDETGSKSAGIADVIDGFPDGLAAVARSDGQSLELLVWPVRGDPIERTIPVGVSRPPDPVAFDVSESRIATMLPLPDSDLGVLYSGVPSDAAIIASDVTGYAWHDTAALQLAFTTFVDDELLLWAMRQIRSEPELITRVVGIYGRVAAWGDWGFAIQDLDSDSIVLFTDVGEIKDTHPGRVLDSDGTGWLAIEAEGVSLVSAGGGVQGLEEVDAESGVLAGAFSDDGGKLALLTGDLIEVVALEGDSEAFESEARPGVPLLAWTSDGRFVAYPETRGIRIVDTIDREATEVLSNRTFTGLGMLDFEGQAAT
jgi:hypothetical protein